MTFTVQLCQFFRLPQLPTPKPPLTHSRTYSHTHVLIHSLTHHSLTTYSLTHYLLTHSLTTPSSWTHIYKPTGRCRHRVKHSLTHYLLTHPHTYSPLTHSLTHTLTHSLLTHSLTHLLTHHLLTHSLTHSHIHMQPLPPAPPSRYNT